MKKIIIHDVRLAGQVRLSRADRVFGSSAKRSLTEIFNRTYWQAQSFKKENPKVLCEVEIWCHGYEQTYTDDSRNSKGDVNTEDRGGFGLQLGSEKLLQTNLAQFASLLNANQDRAIDIITLRACSIADCLPNNRNKFGDGQKFCSDFAKISKTVLFASSVPQQIITDPEGSGLSNIFIRDIEYKVQMGWRGTVYKFNSNDGGNSEVLELGQGFKPYSSMLDQSKVRPYNARSFIGTHTPKFFGDWWDKPSSSDERDTLFPGYR